MQVPPPPPAADSHDAFSSYQWQAWFNSLRNFTANISVGLQMPTNTFTVTGSPITNNGTFGVTYNSQSAGTFLAAPAVGTGTPTWRSITNSDLPSGIGSSSVLTWMSFY